MTDAAGVAALLGRQRVILLDFDGPVCAIFANHPAPEIARTLCVTLREIGIEPPSPVAAESDPLEVLRWTATLGMPDAVRRVEKRLCAEELVAAETAEPTRYGREAIIAAYEAGKPVAIVSNNSAPAISAYLRRQRLERYTMPVCGREFGRPELMKPNPEPILRAAKAVGAHPSESVLIGDSLADIDGARAAQVSVVGYANREEKLERFRKAGADIVLTSMADIACALIEMKL